jgi:hypothetical protein
MDQSTETIDPKTSKSTSEYIDKITLELLINKNQYNKYIASVDPEKHKKITEFSDKLAKYSEQILSLTEQYCSNPKTQKTTEMDEMFVQYVKTCFRYFEMKELEGDPEFGQERFNQDNDEDVLFANVAAAPVHSFWGKGAKKKYP